MFVYVHGDIEQAIKNLKRKLMKENEITISKIRLEPKPSRRKLAKEQVAINRVKKAAQRKLRSEERYRQRMKTQNRNHGQGKL